MLDALNPAPISHLDLFGHPWHGLVRGGKLALPNGTQIDYPQPVSGDVHLIQVPGAEGGARLSPEQLEAETAAGRTWPAYALLSGNQVWGQPIGGWIYVDPAGARWRVSLPAMSPVVGAAINIRLDRFGEFGAGAEGYDYTVHVPPYTPVSGGAPDGMRLHAFSPDGSRARIAGQRFVSIADGSMQVPYVWFELSILGPGATATVELTLHLDGDQTVQLGASSSIMAGWQMKEFRALYDTTYIEIEPPDLYEYVLFITGTDGSVSPSGGGNAIRVGSGSVRLQVSEWVFGYTWWGGDFVAISLACDLTNAYSYPDPQFDASGRLSYERKRHGDNIETTYNGYMIATGSRTCSITSSAFFALKFGGNVVDSVQHSSTVTHTFSFSCAQNGRGLEGFRSIATQLHHISSSNDGLTFDEDVINTSSTLEYAGWPSGLGVLGPLDDSAIGAGSGISVGYARPGGANMPSPVAGSSDSIAAGFDDPGNAFMCAWRIPDPYTGLSSQYVHRLNLLSVALACIRTDYLPHDPVDSTSSLGPIHGPGGASATAPNGVAASDLFATFHPVTGQIAISYPDPCCWV